MNIGLRQQLIELEIYVPRRTPTWMGVFGMIWATRKEWQRQYVRKSKKYKAAYLDLLDQLYGDYGDLGNEKDKVGHRDEPASISDRSDGGDKEKKR